jgi:hypothetical protein
VSKETGLATRFRANARSFRATSCRGLGLFSSQFTCTLEALFALVFAQDTGLIDTGLEAPQELVEGLAFASFYVHALILS